MSSGIATGRKRGLSQRLPQALSLSTNYDNISNIMHGIANAFSATSLTANSTLPEPGQDHGEITCWVVDTRTLWPGKDIWSAPGATEAMSLISMQEQKAISTKMFIQDARMSLASALIKRLYVSKTLDIPWKDVALARKGDQKHGKPCAVDTKGRPIEGIDFNVSHQAGLVALIGWKGSNRHKYNHVGGIEGSLSSPDRETFESDVMVGVDIVCVNERDDYRTIDVEGMDGWVDIYDFVFSDEERWSMKYDVDYVPLNDGSILSKEDLGRHDRCVKRHQNIRLNTPTGKDVSFSSNELIDAKLRRFYTYFCYKEAYIKLAGEALLAPWLKNLEFNNVRSPKPIQDSASSTKWGEEVEDVEVHLNKSTVEDVRMKIVAFESNIMLSTAIQGRIEGVQVPAFTMIDLRRDILSYAHTYLKVTTPVEQR